MTCEINHPRHYTMNDIEPIDVIESWKLDFSLGNVVKYIARAEYKGDDLRDLQKAKWYLEREIQRRSKEQGRPDTKFASTTIPCQ